MRSVRRVSDRHGPERGRGTPRVEDWASRELEGVQVHKSLSSASRETSEETTEIHDSMERGSIPEPEIVTQEFR